VRRSEYKSSSWFLSQLRAERDEAQGQPEENYQKQQKVEVHLATKMN
jgi:hypothetical protein